MAGISKLIEDDLIANYAKYYRLAFSYVGNEQDALDIVQEGAYKAVKNAKKIKSPEYISTWIYRIIINEALNQIRENKKTVSLLADIDEGVNDSYEDPDLNIAIKRLDLIDQTIIKLRFFLDIPIKEIAAITNLNENTTKTRLYRALEKLKIKKSFRGNFISFLPYNYYITSFKICP